MLGGIIVGSHNDSELGTPLTDVGVDEVRVKEASLATHLHIFRMCVLFLELEFRGNRSCVMPTVVGLLGTSMLCL